jgi:heptosyltransferase-2
MQPTETTIEDYIEWINSCKIIVSNDSLGIHLAMAMNKKIVGLFGPTPAKEMPPYKNAVWIQKEKMEDITIQEVTKAIKEIYGRV